MASSPATLPTFEETLFGPFTIILQQDIDRTSEPVHIRGYTTYLSHLEYIPYVFQVLAQMLELHKGGQVPQQYRSILPLLLTPAVWQQKGSIPGLVRLLKAFLVQDSTQMAIAGQIAPVLAVAQQRLIPSKNNDAWGIELLQSVVLHVNP